MSMRQFKAFILFQILWVCLIYSCANVVPPSGGPKDAKPPMIIESYPSQRQVNFVGKSLSLRFNEYAEIKDPNKNIQFSPPLKLEPNYKINGKTLEIQLKEDLQSDMTYHIVFSNALADYHEGNILNSYDMLFSTGNKIDTGYIKGEVINGYSLNGEADVLVVLAKNRFFLENAFYQYITKTSTNGSFTFGNIKEGAYEMLAFKDENENKKYDENEGIAFIDTLAIHASTHIMQISYPIVKQRLGSFKNSELGKLEFNFLKEVADLELNAPILNSANSTFELSTDKKNVVIWYTTLDSPELDMVITANRELKDTINKKLKARATAKPQEFFCGKDISAGNANRTTGNAPISPGTKFTIKWAAPIKHVYKSRIQLFEDSIKSIPFDVSINAKKREFSIQHNWKPKGKYRLIIKDSALVDYRGFFNRAIEERIEIAKDKLEGDIDVKIKGLNNKKQYIITVMKEKTEEVFKKIESNKDSLSFSLVDARIGNYDVYVYEDANRNKKWDGNDYKKRKQAEKVKMLKSFAFKGGVEMELELNWKEGN